ncbi:ABC transporter ATP-binding protein [Nigerium massiliense]|uniref:ABC transporter ATP-binding protein n=1 Tax=Nigerium massiliense TaxID=1522317 RepID=UPI000590F5AC|nr:ABC transporter ATP-binding protein [Nigerium massiliense]
MTAVVVCEDVRRSFDTTVALDGVSLAVRRGEIFGIVGPNGAGKTTLLNCLEGLDSPTSGRVEVLGLDPVRHRAELATRVGVQLQSAALPPRLTVGESLELYSALYPQPQPWRPLLSTLGIEGKAKDRVDRLSGGERQRVFVALALLHRPELAFLDELTTALDPQSRRDMWGTVEQVRDQGATVVLTTHYMEEAERLCDRVAIIDHGRIVALDTVPALVAQYAPVGTARFVLSAVPTDDLSLADIPGVGHVQLEGRDLVIRGSAGVVPAVLSRLADDNITVTDVSTTSPGLEDVFLALTGRGIHSEGTH